MRNKNKFYVYVYLDPRKLGKYYYDGLDFCFLYEPFYVGKGTGYRFRKHLSEKKENTTNNFKFNKIQKIRRETGLEPFIIKILENSNNEDCLILESKIISILKIKSEGGILTNISNLGTNNSGHKHIKETKLKISKNNSRHWKGKKKSEETKKKISETKKKQYKKENHPMFGKKHTNESKEKMSKSRIGKKLSKEHIENLKKNNKNKKKWLLISPDGEKIIVKGLYSFARENNLKDSALRRVSKGLRKTHRGWKCFKYENN